jgi:uncharacterized membrane protein HdeD (DUF308 family)
MWVIVIAATMLAPSIPGSAGSRIWRILLGCFTILFGLVLMYFRHELPQVFADRSRRSSFMRLVLMPGKYSPKYFVFVGFWMLLIGIAFILDALQYL